MRNVLAFAALSLAACAPAPAPITPVSPPPPVVITQPAAAQPTTEIVVIMPPPAAQAPVRTTAGTPDSANTATCSTDTKDLIYACIHETFRRTEARACYDEARKNEPNIEGHLIVGWTVNDQGVVTEVHFDDLNSQIHSEAVRSCMTGVFKRIRFNLGTPGHIRTSAYDFKFTPNG